MSVSLWSNQGEDGEYADKTLFESTTNMVVKYFGQRKGGRDHLISEDANFFLKNVNGYIYIGIVNSVSQLPKENNINVFELMINKGTPINFRTKNDASRYFGWNEMNRFEVTHGIIKHS
jgi:hypothetical protein